MIEPQTNELHTVKFAFELNSTVVNMENRNFLIFFLLGQDAVL